MCKLELLRKGIFRIKDMLMRYEDNMTQGTKQRFLKDLSMIFNGAENIQNLSELQKMEKMAKTKLKSVARIYGEFKTDDNNISNSLLDEELEKTLLKTFNIDPNKPHKPKGVVEMRKMPGFNPELVKQHQEEYFAEQKLINEGWKILMKEKLEEKRKKRKSEGSTGVIESMHASGSQIDLSQARDGEGNLDKDKLKIVVKDMMAKHNVPDPEQRAEEVDYDGMIKELVDLVDGRDEAQVEKTEMIEKIKDSKSVDISKSRELFKVFDHQKTISENELDAFIEKTNPIFEDSTLTQEEKKQKFLKELDVAETEWTRNNMDGYIRYGPYGDIQVEIYKDKGEDSSDEEESKEKIIEQKEKTEGVKNFVWRDGKLVEGKARERKVVTYSNWHSGHTNPDDMRRHKELIDRQHFGGPLWEGIKYKGNFTKDGESVIIPPTEEQLEKYKESSVKLPDGKPEIIEIVR